MAKSPKPRPIPRSLPKQPQQLSIAFDSNCLRGLSLTDRAKALGHLANLLILAAGVEVEELDDDQR